jgi:hypothetical protein
VTDKQIQEEREEKKRYLLRKLSFRPSVDELKNRKVIKIILFWPSFISVDHHHLTIRRSFVTVAHRHRTIIISDNFFITGEHHHHHGRRNYKNTNP